MSTLTDEIAAALPCWCGAHDAPPIEHRRDCAAVYHPAVLALVERRFLTEAALAVQTQLQARIDDLERRDADWRRLREVEANCIVVDGVRYRREGDVGEHDALLARLGLEVKP